ncbi:MAG: NAD(+) synthase, partial [Rikenellaceae bacterium]
VSSADFVDKCYAALEDIAISGKDIDILIGMPTQSGDDYFSSMVYLHDGNVTNIFSKAMIDSRLEKCHVSGIDSPDYNDESEDSESEIPMNIIEVEKKRFLIVIGEDLDYLEKIDKALKIDAIISLANPIYSHEAISEEYEVLCEAAKEFKIPIIRCASVGANAASFVNFGASCSITAKGEVVRSAKTFKSDIFFVETDTIHSETSITKTVTKRNTTSDNHSAIKLAITDFFGKQELKKAVIGLSGGIDSAVVAALAVDALGKENVTAILMPSEFSSEGSVSDSLKLVKTLGIKHHKVSIADMFNSVTNGLNPIFGALPFSVAEENIQARLRGVILMAYSNKFGDIVLNTTNKSECAVGYGTLYGDTNGSLSILADLYKGEVYDLAEYINSDREIIPREIIEKTPSAELRPDQKDSDSLPEYSELDAILHCLIEENMSVLETVAKKHNVDTVAKVAKLIATSEHKRFQLPPIVKLSSATLGIDRIYPIASKLTY